MTTVCYVVTMNPAQESFHVSASYSKAGARILNLAGPLTLRTLFDFQAVSREESDKSVIIDLSGVPYMDSAGLGSVISVFTRCQTSGRAFALCGMTERIRTLLQITQVDGLLPNFETLEAAEAAVS